MRIIDSQIHPYERDHPGRPWVSDLPGPREMTGQQLIAAMDSVSVDAAILVSAFAMYRYDASYAVSVRDSWPDRFALVKPVDPNDPAVGEIVTDWAKTPGVVAARILIAPPHMAAGHPDVFSPQDADDPGFARVLDAATRAGLAVNLACVDDMPMAGELARRYPDCQFVIDHLGLRQPPVALSEDRFETLAGVLDVARYPNVAIKVSGVCTLSKQPFPFADIWTPLLRVFDAYGIDRCLWGTDWTRAVDYLSFKEGVDAFLHSDRLSDGDRATLMGGALQRVYRWTPGVR